MEAIELTKINALEEENAKLKRMYADFACWIIIFPEGNIKDSACVG